MMDKVLLSTLEIVQELKEEVVWGDDLKAFAGSYAAVTNTSAKMHRE